MGNRKMGLILASPRLGCDGKSACYTPGFSTNQTSSIREAVAEWRTTNLAFYVIRHMAFPIIAWLTGRCVLRMMTIRTSPTKTAAEEDDEYESDPRTSGVASGNDEV